MILRNKQTGESHPLSQHVFTAGSGSINNLVLQGEQIRKIHFQILRKEGGFTLLALNGTLDVNGGQVAEHTLRVGDEIRIGDHVLKAEETSFSALTSAAGEISAYSIGRNPYERLLEGVIPLLVDPDKNRSSEEILSLGMELMEADGGYLFTLDGSELNLLYSFPEDNPSYSNSAVHAAISRKETIIWSGSDTDEEVSTQSIAQKHIYSILVSPLFERARGEIAGLLYLHRKESDAPFSEEQRRLFSRISQVLGAVLSSNQVHLEQVERIETLQEIKGSGDLIFACGEMSKLVEMANRSAASQVPVLITGETGTGKDVMASYIHRHSPRSSHPFIAVNCGAIPEHLIESELFGHEKGSFTGATTQQKGLFEQAAGGTVFLDEIGELPLMMQVKFLRILQSGKLRRIGGSEEITVDVRVLAATNRDLQEEIRSGRFREDLYYRLNLVQLHLPPLRDREGDVLLLSSHILKKACANFNMNMATLTKSSEKALLKYGWPGNIRELENKLQKALLKSSSRVIDVDSLEFPEEPEDREAVSLKSIREQAESRAIHLALSKAKGNLTLAASFLAIDRKVLRDIMERLGIDKTGFKVSRR